MMSLIVLRTPKTWYVGVKGRIQSLGEKIDGNNGRHEDLRCTVLEESPKWSISGPREHVTLGGLEGLRSCLCSRSWALAAGDWEEQGQLS